MALSPCAFVNPVDQMSLMIGLPHLDINAQFLRTIFEFAGNIVERIRAINFGLTQPEQVQIGPVQNKDDGFIAHWPSLLVAAMRGGHLYAARIVTQRQDAAMTSDGTISIQVNGEHRRIHPGLSLAEFASEALGLDPAKIAVERNLEVVPRSTLGDVLVEDGDTLEIVHFVGGGDHQDDDSWTVAGQTFTSRLIVGTGKYKDFEENAAALEASGAQIITVAVRRVNVSDPKAPMLTDFIDPKRFTYLPNTAGCFTADEAIRTLRLAREAGGWDLVKLEVLGEAKTLYPDMRETLTATATLAKEGFKPMVYCVDDPIAAKQLEEAGAVAVMPLGAPIGSGLGIQKPRDHPVDRRGRFGAGTGGCWGWYGVRCGRRHGARL